MLTIALLLPLLQETAAAPPAPAPPLADLGPLVEVVLAKHDVPALWGGLVSVDGLVAAGARGVRERGKDQAVTLDDRLHLGSCTKSITASLVAIEAEAERVLFDESIASLFVGIAETIHPDWHPVTVRHLLAHRGGAPANLLGYGTLGIEVTNHPGPPRDARRLLAETVLQFQPARPVGEEYVYSNDGYVLIAAGLEARGGVPWTKLVEKRLYAPLGIRTYGFGPPDATDGQPVGHREGGEPAPKVDNPEAYDPAGRAHLPLAEWAKYAAWHLRGAREGTPELSKAGFHELHTPTLDPTYAMGWIVVDRPWSKGKVLTHSGSNTVWFCAMWLAPEEGVAFLAATNQGGTAAGRAVDEMVAAIILSKDRVGATYTPPADK